MSVQTFILGLTPFLYMMVGADNHLANVPCPDQ